MYPSGSARRPSTAARSFFIRSDTVARSAALIAFVLHTRGGEPLWASAHMQSREVREWSLLSSSSSPRKVEVNFKSRPDDKSGLMTIGELSKESGVPASTIRYYERIGVLPRPGRVSGQRRYSPDALDRLAVLRLAQACGFRIEEMRQLLHGFKPGVTASRRWQELARLKREELDAQMVVSFALCRRLVDRVLECQCPEVRRSWPNCFLRHRVGKVTTGLLVCRRRYRRDCGCFAFWAWLRLGKSLLWTIPGTASLMLFAAALTRVDAPAAGRVFAAYGGIYIVSSLVWLWAVEGFKPDRWDIIGAAVCVLGAAVILLGRVPSDARVFRMFVFGLREKVRHEPMMGWYARGMDRE